MICLKNVKQFCNEYWNIENYQEAVNDPTQMWVCHHRKETEWGLSMSELMEIGWYYNVHYSELIFLTRTEHTRLHKIGKESYWKGKHLTEEHKAKLSAVRKGKVGYWKGKHRTEETKQKMSAARKGKVGYWKGKDSPNHKYYITAKELHDLYIVQGLLQKQIAAIYGCKQATISYKLKKYNIKK